MGNAASLESSEQQSSPRFARKASGNDGILQASSSTTSLNAGSITLPKAMNVLVQREPEAADRRVTFLEVKNVVPLYRLIQQREMDGSSTLLVQNKKGRVLFLGKQVSTTQRILYQVPEPIVAAETDLTETTCSSLSSGKSGRRRASADKNRLGTLDETVQSTPPPPQQPISWALHELPQVAQLDVDLKAGKASLSWNLVHSSASAKSTSGNVWSKQYKGQRIAEFGLLITNVQGQIMAKGDLDKKKQQPLLKLSPGADLPSVLSLAAALYGDF